MKDRPLARALRFVRPVPCSLVYPVMEHLVDARIADQIPDTVLFLEHESVITLGHRGRDQHLLLPRHELERLGIPVVHATRGGDVTYHGPGQLVVYPICKLGAAEADARNWLSNLEEAGIRLCAELGVPAWRVPGQTGVWTEKGKVAAIGVRFRRWVAHHGMSLNVRVSLDFTRWIVPCGLVGKPVTTLAVLLGETCPTLETIADRLRIHLGETIGRNVEWGCPDPAMSEILKPVAEWMADPSSQAPPLDQTAGR
jgi:lipoyl(octanoyl) transferase